MEFRNPIYTADGRIDCEINHAKFGWIPFTASEDDPEEAGRNLFAAIVESETEIAPYVPPAIDLAEFQAALKAQIDAAAEAERMKYVTAGAGQAMTYQRKSEEARRYQAAVAAEETIVPTDYPMLNATIGIDGATLAEVAATVQAMDAAWAVVGSAIEGTRLGGKAAIDAAEDAAAAQAAFDAVSWPSA